MSVFLYNTSILEHHLDTFGHVNNAAYLQLFEEARWDFSQKGGFGLDWVMANKMGPVVLKVELSFRRELGNREKILIESQCLGLKNRLVSIFEQKMVKESGKIASSLKLEVGFMDLEKRKLIPFPEEWLQSVKVPFKEELGLL